MTVTISGTDGITTPGVTNEGDLDIDGNQTVSGTLTVTGNIKGSNLSTVLYPLVSGTMQTASGNTEFSFVNIPSWAKRITIMVNQVVLSSGSLLGMGVEIGASSGYDSTGYVSYNSSGNSSSDYFIFNNTSTSVSSATTGTLTITNLNGQAWMCTSAASNGSAIITGTGAKTISGSSPLYQLKFFSTNGTSTFSSGTINILYE